VPQSADYVADVDGVNVEILGPQKLHL
jgi:hypothetical protein